MPATQRFDTIPVRLIVDANGRVKHVHLLSAFPEQSQAIIAALRTWRFKPYRVEGRAVPVETGLVFGTPPNRRPPDTRVPQMSDPEWAAEFLVIPWPERTIPFERSSPNSSPQSKDRHDLTHVLHERGRKDYAKGERRLPV